MLFPYDRRKPSSCPPEWFPGYFGTYVIR